MKKENRQPLSESDLSAQRASVRSGLLRVQRTVWLIMMLVLAISLIALLQAWRAARQTSQAVQATRHAEEELWHSRLLQAQSLRLSGRVGRKAKSLASIRAAAAMRTSIELRSEAVSALALTDLEPTEFRRQLPWFPRKKAVDDLGQTYAISDGQGRVCLGALYGADHPFVFEPGLGDVFRLKLSPTGKSLALVFGGGEFQIWNPQGRARILEKKGQAFNVLPGAVDFSPDDRVVAVGCSDRMIRFYDAFTGQELQPALALKGEPSGIRFANSGESLAVWSYPVPEVQIWDWRAGKMHKNVALPGVASSLAWYRDDSVISVGCLDGRVCVVEVASGRNRELRGHADNAAEVMFHPRGNLLLSVSWDATSRFWDMASGEALFTWLDVVPLGFSADGESLIAYDGTANALVTWRVQTSPYYRTFGQPAGYLRTCWGASFSPDSRLLAVATDVGVEIWDVLDEKMLTSVPAGKSISVEFAADGKSILVAGVPGLFLWPIQIIPGTAATVVKLGKPERIALPDDSLVCRANFLDGGNLFEVSRQTAGILSLTNLPAKARVKGLWNLNSGDYRSQGGFFATSTWLGDGSRVWDSHDGHLVKDLGPEDAFVAFTRDGEGLVVGTAQEYSCRRVGSWEPQWRIPRVAVGLTGPIGVQHSGKTLAIAKSTQLAQLVNSETGELIVNLEPPNPRLIRNLNFSQDDHLLAVTTADQGVQVWNLKELRREIGGMNLDWGAKPVPEQPLVAAAIPGPNPALLVLVVGSIVMTLALLSLVFRRHRRLIEGYEQIDRMAVTRGRELVSAQAEVIHSHKMKAIGTMAAGVAHDFNNLLSVIRMANKSIARQVPGEPGIVEDLADIEATVLQGKSIVGSMLGYCRDPGTESPVCSIYKVVNDTLNLLSKPFLGGMQIEMDMGDQTDHVPVSAARLSQILLNLFVNATEAMAGQGKLRVSVKAHVVPGPGSYILRPRPAGEYWELVVQDTGPGISPAVLGRIFEPFFTTKHSGATRGTGLGLSVVYSLAEQEGIGIMVNTEPGAGTAVRLIIPKRTCA